MEAAAAPPDPATAPVAVVTGSSSGIGLAVAIALARRGFRVVATMRRVASAPDVLREHPGVVLHPLDVASDDSVAELAAWLMDDANASRLDVVVNNAGIGQSGTVETVPIDVAKQVFEVNLWGVMRVCRQLLPVMRHRGRGGIFHLVSAGMGLHGFPCNDIYASSKFAVEGMMESMRFSVAPDNIKVTISNPGPVTSNWFERMENSESEPDANKPTLLAHKLTAVERGFLQKYRETKGQSAESCAESIVDVIERERVKRVDQGKVDVRLWNGTSEAAEATIANVKRYPSGNDGPAYEAMWNMAFNIAKVARDAPNAS